MARLIRQSSLLWVLLLLISCGEDPSKVLYIYNSADNIDMTLLQDFQKETGIRVIYDVYDSNDVLEAKILTGHSGYDLVFPSSYPYLARQLKSGVYAKLDKAQLPNLKLLDPGLVQNLSHIPGANDHAVPYVWSITVIGYRADLIEKHAPGTPVHSLESLYNEKYLKPLSKCGVGYLEEPVDVLPLAFHYLGYSPNTSNVQQISQGVEHLKRIRPYVKQFSSVRPTEDLISGDMCLVQTWLGFIMGVQSRVKNMKNRPDIRYAIPQEGTSMWLDVMAIPVDAPHKDNAHRFINYILRPENMARVTKKTFYHNAVPRSREFIPQDLWKKLELPPSVRENLFQSRIIEPSHMKKLTRALQSVVTSK